MAPADVDELERLLAAATPAPWRYDAGGNAVWLGEREAAIAYVVSAEDGLPHEQDTTDARLIAALRNAAPALLAAVRERDALRARVAELLALLGRADPVRCPTCGEIRERAESACGNCTSPLDPAEAAKWRADVGDGFDAWRRWFRESGLAEAWNEVPCIECDLDRRHARSACGRVAAGREPIADVYDDENGTCGACASSGPTRRASDGTPLCATCEDKIAEGERYVPRREGGE